MLKMFSPSQNSCNSSPCMKHATCRPSFLDDENYTCVCPAGFAGAMCNGGKKCLLKSLSLYDLISRMDDEPVSKRRLAAHNLIKCSCIRRFRLLFTGIARCHIHLVPRVFYGEMKDPGKEVECHILYI